MLRIGAAISAVDRTVLYVSKIYDVHFPAACRYSSTPKVTLLDRSTLNTFVAVVLGLFLIPGPSVLLVLSRTVQGGRKTGILTGLGIANGDFVHTLFAAVGLSALLMASALAFNVVKYVGAMYLI
jgi:hypothetical protein